MLSNAPDKPKLKEGTKIGEVKMSLMQCNGWNCILWGLENDTKLRPFVTKYQLNCYITLNYNIILNCYRILNCYILLNCNICKLNLIVTLHCYTQLLRYTQLLHYTQSSHYTDLVTFKSDCLSCCHMNWVEHWMNSETNDY